jgi:hypothetical protein
MILAWMAKSVAGIHSKSAVDFDVGRKFFLFQFLIVFIFNTLLGSLSSAKGNNPVKALSEEVFSRGFTGVIDWIGEVVPQQASFFIMFIFTSGLFTNAIGFLNLPGAAIFWILTKISGSRRQMKRCWSQQFMAYGPAIPTHSIVLLLVIVFSIIQPFLPLVGLAYFVVNYFYARYNLLYTMREPYQSGGMFWPVVRAPLRSSVTASVTLLASATLPVRSNFVTLSSKEMRSVPLYKEVYKASKAVLGSNS